MDLLDLQPISNEPALFIENKKMLVVADLHIGIENELRERGLNIASQTKNMIDHLILLCKKYKPKEIVLLGDIKHNIPSSTIQERRDVENFLEIIQTYGKIHIIPGNHDGNIKKLLSDEIIIHPSDGFIIENIGFIHGHRWPSEEIMLCKQIIAAHTHPTIMLTDRLGYKTFEPCWIKGKPIKSKLKEKYSYFKDISILIMPAFNKLCGGIAANKYGITGPIGKIININNAQIYLLNGSALGKAKDIE
ncbi:MAG: metallophosphoesterase [Thermoplasmatales archaeon]|nr:MAG: metallophosphoesterase [Thermoplasmatales archaeon]